MTTDLLAVLHAAAAHYPDRVAVSERSGRSITHRQLQTRYLTLAQGLIDKGFAPGDRLLLAMRPSLSSITIALACVAAGGSVLTTHTNLSQSAFADRWNVAEPAWVAADSVAYALSRPGPALAMAKLAGLTLADLSRLPATHIHSGPWLPGVPRSALSFKRLMNVERRLTAPIPGDEVVIVFTSGRRTDNRAVSHSAQSIGAMVTGTARALELQPDDRVFTDQLMLGLATLGTGAEWQLPSSGYLPRFDPQRFGSEIGDASVFFASPTDLADIAHGVAAGTIDAPTGLRSIVTGAALVTPQVIRAASTLVPAEKIKCVYGMTEMIPISVTNGRDLVAYAGDGAYVGPPSKDLDWSIDAAGQLSVTGPSMAPRYLPDEPIDRLPTGDVATFVDGAFVLLGRVGDQISRNGTVLYPATLERRLSEVDGFIDAGVVGVTDMAGRTSVVLCLVPDGVNKELFDTPAVLSDMWLPPDLHSRLDEILRPEERHDLVLALSRLPRCGRPQLIDRVALRSLAESAVHEAADGRTA